MASSCSTIAARSSGFRRNRRREPSCSRLANTGVYIFSPAIFEHIPAGEFYDFGKQVFPALQTAGAAFYGFEAGQTYWADIGTPSEYRRASYDVVRGVVQIPLTHPNGVDPSAIFGEGVRVEGPVRIGAGVHLGDGVSIVGPSILDDGVRVDAGARLERAILWEGATIGARAELRDTIVGNDAAVDAEAILDNLLVARQSNDLS